MQDQLTVLTTADGKRLAKVIARDAEGYHVEGYEAGARYAWSVIDVAGLDEIEYALRRLAEDRQSCVIRGAIRDGSQHKAIVNRCHHVQADGRQPDWDHHAPGRRWVAFDIDKMRLLSKPSGGWAEWLEGVARMARDRLPEPFRTSGCVYKLSSSAGLDGWDTVSLHLWFWLGRPVYDLSWREWAEGVEVDSSLFKSVQPHYTADPAFDGCADPLRGLRIGRLVGVSDVVTVPPELLGYADWLERHKAAIRARQAELEEARKRIVGGMQQTRSATRRYAAQALAGAVDDILSAPVGGRHGTLVTKAFKMGGYVQDGFLGEAELLSALEQAVSATFPPKRHREELRAVREMVTAGMAQPLDLSHIGRQAPQPKASKKRHLELVIETEGSAAIAVTQAEPERRSGGPQWPDIDDKGKPLKTAANLACLIAWLGIGVRWNLMSHEPHWTGGQFDGIALECRNGAVASKIMDEAVRLGWSLTEPFFYRSVAALQAENAFHPVAEWASSVPWDGVSRFDSVMATLKVQPKYQRFMPLFRAQLRAWLVAGGKCLALRPSAEDGVEVQGVLVLQGRQGAGKTRWFKSLLSEAGWVATGIKLDPSEKDSIRRATSSFLCELGELDSTTRKADVAMLKAFLTESKDVYRTPYGRVQETFVRRTIYGASVNPDDFLKDPTGNRRFWPIPVTETRPITDIDMQQVWAEAVHHARSGERWWLSDDMAEMHEELVSGFAERSPWADEFFAKFEVPEGDDVGTPWKVRDIRREMMGEYYKWSDADMKRFTQFLKTVVPVYQSKGVTVARLNRVVG